MLWVLGRVRFLLAAAETGGKHFFKQDYLVTDKEIRARILCGIAIDLDHFRNAPDVRTYGNLEAANLMINKEVAIECGLVPHNTREWLGCGKTYPQSLRQKTSDLVIAMEKEGLVIRELAKHKTVAIGLTEDGAQLAAKLLEELQDLVKK